MSHMQAEAVSLRDSMLRLKSAQKSSRGAPLYSLVVNRPLGRVLAACAHQVGLVPNQVTMLSAVFTYSAIVVIAVMRPGLASAIMVTVGLIVGYALDAADGQLSRLRGGGSLTGEWLDHIIDSGKIATLHLAVLICAYRYLPVPQWWLFVPLVFTSVSVVHFFGMLLTDLLTRIHSGQTATQVVASPSSRLMSLLKLPTDYGLLCLSFILLAIPVAFVVLYTLLTIAMVGYTAVVIPRWYVRLDRLRQI